MDLLFGLDMLKAHQACIDLEKNVLRIQGREVKFLSEHELPDKARLMQAPVEAQGPPQAGPPTTGRSSGAGPSTPFPGSGHTIGGAPSSAVRGAQLLPAPTSRHPEHDIQTLEGLGATRERAIRALDDAGGNVDYAASLLF